MTITVRFFASVREQVGKAEDFVDVHEILSVADVWRRVTSKPRPANLLAAVNQEYVPWHQSVEDGDEVAFFPPVTGG